MTPKQDPAAQPAIVASGSAAGAQPVGSQDDALLLRRLADGDRDALTRIYERHAGAALALARHICGSHAAEVVDEACLALWRQARAGHGDGPSRTRLLRLTRERALDRLHDGHHRIGSGAGAAGQPEAVSLIELNDDDAQASIRAAPPAERQCIRLAYVNGLSVAQIAARTGLPAATVSDHIRRGIDHVRRHQHDVHPPDAA